MFGAGICKISECLSENPQFFGGEKSYIFEKAYFHSEYSYRAGILELFSLYRRLRKAF